MRLMKILVSWNTSNVTDMDSMFANASVFNQDISSWNTSNVRYMIYMFTNASAFNGDISSWDTSNVFDMRYMFNAALVFDQDISNWDTSNVTNMIYMFNGASAFDQYIRGWDTLSGPVSDYNNMFTGANAMISTYTGVTGFGTSPTSAFFNFTPPTLDFTFDNGATAIGAISLPYQGSGIAVSVDWGDGTTDTSLTHTYTATSATAKVQLTGGTITGFGANNWSGVALLTSVANNTQDDNWGWGTGAITLEYAFYNASKLTSVPSTIPVGTNNMYGMFGNASVFNQDISSWDTSNVTIMGYMFFGASAFNGDILGWDTSNVTAMNSMFDNASAFNQYIRGWNTLSGPVSDYNNMFSGATAMISTYTGVTGFGTSPNYTPTSAFFNFTPPTLDFTFDNGATAIGDVYLPFQGSGTFSVDWGDGVTNTSLTHTYTATSATAKVTLTGGTITGFGSLRWTGYQLLTKLENNTGDDNWGFGTGSISFNLAFFGASKLTSVPSTIPVGTNNMSNMFKGAGAFNGDISGWNTSNVTNMTGMLADMSAFNKDISSWNTGNVTTMTYMFSDASAFNGDISSWDTSNVFDMRYMFNAALVFDQDISNWDTSNVTNMIYMFNGASAFDQYIRGWDTLSGPVSDYTSMFQNATAMISTYTGVTGFGETPNSDFFNFTPTLDFTFDNGATAIGAISLPYQGSGIAVSVDWGDGTTDTSLTHTYTATSATAKVQLTGGTITGFGAQNWSGYQLLTELADNTQDDNWGFGTGAITLEYAFYNASKLTSVPSTIPVGTNNLTGMFGNASVFNQDISSWDTSNVTNMGFMFSEASVFDQNIRGWDTLNVSDYTSMFQNATAMISTYTGVTGFGETPNSDFFNFTPTLDFTFDNGTTAIGLVTLPYVGTGLAVSVEWGDGTTSTTLSHTYTATSATAKVQLTGGTITVFGPQNWSGYQLLTELADNTQDDNWGFGTGSISFNLAFFGASKLTSVPSTIPVGTRNMRYMFFGASVFNKDISSWDTSNVTNMYGMFNGAIVFNQNIRRWNTTNVTNYNYMFESATAMISTYTGVTGFGNSPNYTPTSAFFNQFPILEFTFDNGTTAIGAVSLPYQGSQLTFSVDWGDGVTNNSLTHTYTTATSATAKVTLTGGTITGFGAENWSGVAVLTELANNTEDDNWGFGTGPISFNMRFIMRVN